MLPTMRPVEESRTKNARATKLFEEIRVGAIRLYFSHFELIAFQIDGAPPVVSFPRDPGRTTPAGHVEAHRLQLEPDRAKWLDRVAFEKKWEETGAGAFWTG